MTGPCQNDSLPKGHACKLVHIIVLTMFTSKLRCFAFVVLLLLLLLLLLMLLLLLY